VDIRRISSETAVNRGRLRLSDLTGLLEMDGFNGLLNFTSIRCS
jgi:hypothetical protein